MLVACVVGLSAPQLLLHMDQDELLDVLGMSPAFFQEQPHEDARKQALAFIHTGREGLRRDFHVTLKELPDAMDRAVYVLERFPLVVDALSGGQATRFLKYQRGSVLMVGNPRDMAPESLRRHLVGALKHGSLLIIDFDALNTIELEQFFAPDTFPREVLDRQALFTPSVFGKLLRTNEGDPETSEFLVNDQFKLVVVCKCASPPPKTALAMCVLHVHLPSEQADSGVNSSEAGSLAKLLGVGKEVKRNSLELVEAAFDNDLETVAKCLEKNYDLESEDGHAHTALSEAACQGNDGIVRLLLERGADPNKCNDEKRSPLYRACYNGHMETITLLLASGADPRIHTKQAETAFDVAKTPEIRELLTQWDLSNTEKLLEERRKLIEAKWQERITSHVEREQFALMQIHRELLELAHKGDADAIEKRFEQFAEDALATGERPRASADIRDEKGSTLLALAAQHDHVEVVSLLVTKWKLLAESARAAALASSSQPQQQLAKKHELLAKMLKANVNSRDCRGWTPVAIAVFHEAKRSLRLLLENGADPKLKNQYNKSAYDFAKDDLDAANCVVKSRAEIRQVLIDWENERRVVTTEAAVVVVSPAEVAGPVKGGKQKPRGKKPSSNSKASASGDSGAKPVKGAKKTPATVAAKEVKANGKKK